MLKNKFHILLVAIAVTAIFALVTHHGQGPMLGRLDIAMFRTINQDIQNPVLDSLAQQHARSNFTLSSAVSNIVSSLYVVV